MTLRHKVAIFLILLGPVFALVFYGLLWFTVIHSFDDLEKTAAISDVNRTINRMDGIADSLDLRVSDWAQWDDAYQFMKDHNQAFIQSTLLPESLKVLKVNDVMFVDTNGKPFFNLGINLSDISRDKQLEQGLASELPRFFSKRLLQEKSRGFLLLDRQSPPLLIVSRPILHSDGSGTADGVLFFAKSLDLDVVQEISKAMLFPVGLYRLDQDVLPSDYIDAIQQFNDGNTSVAFSSASEVRAYALLNDYFGQPALILGIQKPLALQEQAHRILGKVGWIVSMTSLAMVFVLLLILDLSVINRLTRFARATKRVGEGDQDLSKLELKGSDELSALSQDVIRMVQHLSEAQRRLKASEERYHGIVENQDSLILRFDPQGRITYVNDAVCRNSGKLVDELIGQKIDPFVLAEDLPRAKRAIQELLKPPYRRLTIELRLNTSKGPRWMSLEGGAILDSAGQVIETQIVCRDIDDAKNALAAIEAKKVELEQMNRLMVGRELRMVELKETIDDLKRRAGDQAA